MAEPVRKTVSSMTVSPLHEETAESPRPHAVPQAAPAGKRSKEQTSGADAVRRLRRRVRVRWTLFALLPLVLLAGGYHYVTGGQIMSTDDAYVQADRVGISTDVSGIVQDVVVKDNEHVEAGQVLYRLDPRQFQIALDLAKANLAQTAMSIGAMKEDYQRMLSDVAAQQAQVDLDQKNYDRNAMLLKSATVSLAVFDQTRYGLDNDKSKLAAFQHQVKVQLAKLGGDPDAPTTSIRNIAGQGAARRSARQLDHTIVKAPFAGIVTNVPSIAPGKYLAASTTPSFWSRPTMCWIDANPKETELTYVRPGQPATVTVDTYPDVEWHGTVESISPAAAQEFSLLPAQNTSGNWVKVVQRIPMRVRVDTSDKRQPPLRAGMSVEVDVDTGHARGLPHFLVRRCSAIENGHNGRRTTTQPQAATAAAITVCVMLATLMQALDTTIANVALPYMQGSVSATPGPDHLGADLLHRRRGDHDAADRLSGRPLRAQALFLVSIAGFTVASMLCGMAQSLVADRVVPDPAGRRSAPRSSRCRNRCCSTSIRPSARARRWRSGASA